MKSHKITMTLMTKKWYKHKITMTFMTENDTNTKRKIMKALLLRGNRCQRPKKKADLVYSYNGSWSKSPSACAKSIFHIRQDMVLANGKGTDGIERVMWKGSKLMQFASFFPLHDSHSFAKEAYLSVVVDWTCNTRHFCTACKWTCTTRHFCTAWCWTEPVPTRHFCTACRGLNLNHETLLYSL